MRFLATVSMLKATDWHVEVVAIEKGKPAKHLSVAFDDRQHDGKLAEAEAHAYARWINGRSDDETEKTNS